MNSNIRSSLCLLVSLAMLLGCGFALATEEPISIAADRMSATEKKNSVTFSGNVDARQGDIRIRADRMEVFYTQKEKSSAPGKEAAKQQVERMVCTGKVEISRTNWLGTADRLDYLERKRKVILSGNAKVWQDKNMVTGDKIVYHLDEGRSEVVTANRSTGSKGGKKQGGRVQMTILQN